MLYRLMVRLFTLVTVVACSSLFVSCSSLIGSQSNSKVDLKQLDLSTRQVESKTKLMLAAEQGNSTQLRIAFEQGAQLNSISPEGTAFSLALINGHKSISRILLSAGSDWRSGFTKQHSSALIFAAEQGFDDLVKLLIVRGAEIDQVDGEGYAAISKASMNGHLTTLKILINAGANVDVISQGRSVLMHVVEDNNMLLSQLLIAAGADVNFQDEHGDTALRVARRKGYFDLDLMLVQAGAQP